MQKNQFNFKIYWPEAIWHGAWSVSFQDLGKLKKKSCQDLVGFHLHDLYLLYIVQD